MVKISSDLKQFGEIIMYNSDEEYLKATKDALVNTYVEPSEKRGLWLFTNMLLLLALVVVGFLYFTKGNNYLSENLFGKKKGVLGVSHRSTESDYSDEELMVILNTTDNETAVAHSQRDQQAELSNGINQLVTETSMRSKSSYEVALSKELEDKNKGVKGRIILVKKGDTLSSLAEKYYGNSMAFDKIIEYNKNITKQSPTLYVGEKIIIPY